MTLRIAVDIGGTFTDGVAQRSSDGRIWIAKAPTTPGDPGEAVTTVLRALLAAIADEDGNGAVVEVVHGTTLVTNAMIERKGCRTAMIVTAGTGDSLALRREDRYDLYDLDIAYPDPLVPRGLTFETSARMGPAGEEVSPVEADDLARLIAALRDVAPEALAICLLHAYADGRHEREIAAAIRTALPALPVTLSSEVAPEIREYERASTTAANAYVLPLMGRYLEGIAGRLAEARINGPLRIMTSSGGFVSSGFAARQPVRILESGPAAGVLSAIATAGDGVSHVLAFDMGGTTAKACVAVDGAPQITTLFEAGRIARFAKGSGLPIIAPSIDLIEIGAGGGSIARIDAMGLLKVGPESAGSVPGPVCYGTGGTAPTVTDADLVLGYLNAAAFLGGRMSLDLPAARRAIGKLAEGLGLQELETAFGIFNLVNETMAAAARVHIAEKGFDPRAFTMVATGGAGPVHAAEVAVKLGIGRVVFPVAAGVGSCLGLLAAPSRIDRAWTRVERVAAIDWSRAEAERQAVLAEGREELGRSGATAEGIAWSLSADMRYEGQGDTIAVELPFAPLRAESGPVMESGFAAAYARLYGRALDGSPEVVTWRLVGLAERDPARFVIGGSERAGANPPGAWPAFLPERRASRFVPVHRRYDLAPGTELRAPVILQEAESTIVVLRRAEVTVLPDLSVSVDISEREQP